jgi:hypothetical protein
MDEQEINNLQRICVIMQEPSARDDLGDSSSNIVVV